MVMTSVFRMNLIDFNWKIIGFASCVSWSFLFLYVLDLEGLLLVVQWFSSGCYTLFPPRDFLLRSFVLIFLAGSWIRVPLLELHFPGSSNRLASFFQFSVFVLLSSRSGPRFSSRRSRFVSHLRFLWLERRACGGKSIPAHGQIV
jgi:hypothetical protein